MHPRCSTNFEPSLNKKLKRSVSNRGVIWHTTKPVHDFDNFFDPIQIADVTEPKHFTFRGASKASFCNTADHRVYKQGESPTIKTHKSEDCYPEVDMGDLCSLPEASNYGSLIVIWIVALGRFVISYITSALARYSTVPRQEHYKAAKRIFRYLRHLLKGKEQPIRSHIKYERDDKWNEFYPDAEEIIPREQFMWDI